MMKYNQESLINSLSISSGNDVVFLLGAGCSISSGCMAANKLANEFKRRIYCANNGIAYDENTLFCDKAFDEKIKKYFNEEVDNEYSYYFEKCFPNVLDRNEFIKIKFSNIKPSYGYLCFANYIITHNIKYIMTTNFDKLIEKSINKINDEYDSVITSDNISPVLSSSTNIVKLHGDYNYDSLRNTKEELLSISQNLLNSIYHIPFRKIVVIGYSGQDKSVMQMLKKITEIDSNIEIIWCSLNNDFYESERINDLLIRNKMSGYCLINGFDDLFYNLYLYEGRKNQIIDEKYDKTKNNSFSLKGTNQPEVLQLNCNYIDSNSSPSVYVFKCSTDAKIEKELNSNALDCFYLCYKDYIYAIGNIDEIQKGLLNNSYEILSLEAISIPIYLKCRLIKETIKKCLMKKDICSYENNIYYENNQPIKEGLEINVELLSGKVVLTSAVNYFSINKEITERVKIDINRKKSGLYAKINYEKRKQLIENLFQNEFTFEYYITKISFDKTPIEIGTNRSDSSIGYNCAIEPSMMCNNSLSVNQIKLLNEFGPRKTIFSSNKIKVGIFCVEKDKNKLSRYLALLENGTNRHSRGIIPEFKGFEKTFKKQIVFDFKTLPPFYIHQIKGKLDYKRFVDFCMRGIKKMYDEHQVDIALIYIGNNLNEYREMDNENLHDYIKVKFANKYKTQFLEEKTIDSIDDLNKRIFNLAIAIYTKTIGMPWYPSDYSKDTLYLGISFGKDSTGVTVGCSQMFDGAGRGLQLIISQISDKKRKNQYLTEKEAFELGLSIRNTYYKSSKTNELKRIVIHRVDPFRKEEIVGFKKAFEGINEFDLVQISEQNSINSYKLKGNFIQGYPVFRGTTIKISNDTVLFWSDGSILNSEIQNGMNYRNNTRGMGKPLKLKKFYGQTDANKIVEELMYLTKMDFNSSDVIYSKYPVTIKYSRIVCELLKQDKFDDNLISFEYIM